MGLVIFDGIIGSFLKGLIFSHICILITSGAAGGRESPLHHSAPEELDNIDYRIIPPS
jgi:hypothetical protein